MADLYDSDEEELTIENDAVLTKYKTAGEISNLVGIFLKYLDFSEKYNVKLCLLTHGVMSLDLKYFWSSWRNLALFCPNNFNFSGHESCHK